jgi:hypothetical protein
VNAWSSGDSGVFQFHPDLSVPDVVGHEMTHWLLWAKNFAYEPDFQIVGSVHEGMGDIMGEILAWKGYGQDDWIGGTGVPQDLGLNFRDHSVNPIEQDCYDYSRFEAASNDDGVDSEECFAVWCGLGGQSDPNCEFTTVIEHDPERHDVCTSKRKHTFPCPYHIDYDPGQHTSDLIPEDIHECWDLDGDEIPCPPGLPHTYSSSSSYPSFFEVHNWGRITGRVGYLLWKSGTEVNNGVTVKGLGPSRTNRLMMDTAFSLASTNSTGFFALNSVEADWQAGKLEIRPDYHVVFPPTEWEKGWADVCDTMFESCHRMFKEGFQNYSLVDCLSVADAWRSVGVCDFDDDGVINQLDNCPMVKNSDQKNSDSTTVWECHTSISVLGGVQILECWPWANWGDALGDACDLCPEAAAMTETGCPVFVIPTIFHGPVWSKPWIVRLDNPDWSAIGDKDGLFIYKNDLNGSTETAHLFEGRTVRELIQQGRYLIVGVENTIAVVDLLHVERPRLAAEIALHDKITAMKTFQDNLSRGILSVAAGQRIHQFQIDDLENPTAFPIVVVGEKVLDLDEWDSMLFVAHNSGLTAITTGDDAASVSSINLDRAKEVELLAGTPVVKTSEALVVVDMTVIENPTITQTVPLSLPGYSMSVEEGSIKFKVDPKTDIEKFCESDMKMIVGDEDSNVLKGSNEKECILGLGGGDLVFAGAGRDAIVGGPGDSDIYGGYGNDVIVGNSDDDWLFGDGGRDEIMPHGGFDFVSAGSGDDIVHLYDKCELTPGMLISGGCGYDTLKSPFEGWRQAYWELLSRGVFVIGIEKFEGVYSDGQGAEQAICD